MKRFLFVAAVAVFMCGTGQAKADMVAITTDNSFENLSNPPYTLGWQFTVNSNVSVTALGFFTPNGQALGESVQIGLWNDSTSALLSSTTISAGVSAPLGDNFIFQAVSPVMLSAGTTYDIGALFSTGTNPVQFPGFGEIFSTAPFLNYVGASYGGDGSTNSLEIANQAFGSPGFFGPNFTIATPVPGSLVLLCTGLASFGAFTWMKRRKAKVAA